MSHSTGAEAPRPRAIGACYVAASFIVRWQDCILDTPPADTSELHAGLRHSASRISLRTMIRISLTQSCGCHEVRMLTACEDVHFAQGERGGTC